MCTGKNDHEIHGEHERLRAEAVGDLETVEMDDILQSMEMEEEANNNVPRGRGENGLLGQMYKDEARPENPQKRFMLNWTEEHEALLGPLGNPQTLELNIGSIMSSGTSSDNCIRNTAVDQIVDHRMMGLDHVSKIDKTGISKDYSHELKNYLVRQESQPTKPEATFTLITGLPNQVGSFTESDQMKIGSAELGNLRLKGSDFDQFVQSKETLIGNVFQHGFKHGNEKYLKPFDQDLSESPYSTSMGSISALSDPNFEMESRELKREPQVIKPDDVTWSEGMGLPHFDVWRDSLKDDRKYASNEDVKPDCSDSKQSIKAMPVENNCALQVKLESPKLKYESLNDWTNGEDVIWSEGVRSLQDQFFSNFNRDIHQHVGDKDEKTDHPGEILSISQLKNVDIKMKVEPNDWEEKAAQPSVTCGGIKNEEITSMKFKTEGENIPKLIHRKTEIKMELCQIDLDCEPEWKQQLDAKLGSGCPVLKDEGDQDAFHGKYQSKVNAAYLQVKKEDPALNLDCIKDSYSDVPPDSNFFSDPNGASRNLPTLSQIRNTELVCNEEKIFPANLLQCSKTKDFKIELCSKDEDPIWSFKCSRTKVKTEDGGNFKSSSFSKSQTSHELRNLLTEHGPGHKSELLTASDVSPLCQSQMVTPDQQNMASVLPQQTFLSSSSVQTPTQSSPVLNPNEVAKRSVTQQYSQGGMPGVGTLEAGLIMKYSKILKPSQAILEKLSICKLCGKGLFSHLPTEEERNKKTALKGSSNNKKFWKCCACKLVLIGGRYHHHQHVHLVRLSKPKPQCPECDRTFKDTVQLKTHRDKHILGTFPCKMCSKIFRSERKLKAHWDRCHAPRTLACEICNAAFSAKISLYGHKRRLHSERKLLECTECKSGFRTTYQLEVHMRSHTDERPFTCLKCHAEFILKVRFDAHMKRHLRSESVSRPHKKPGGKNNGREVFSDTETSEEVSFTEEETTSLSDSDTSDTDS